MWLALEDGSTGFSLLGLQAADRFPPRRRPGSPGGSCRGAKLDACPQPGVPVSKRAAALAATALAAAGAVLILITWTVMGVIYGKILPNAVGSSR